MHRFNVVTNAVRARFAGLPGWFSGCSHRSTTFPITLRPDVSVHARQNTQAETYIVCLECGRHFAYDWAAMQVTGQRAVWVRGRVGVGWRLWFHPEAKANRGSR